MSSWPNPKDSLLITQLQPVQDAFRDPLIVLSRLRYIEGSQEASRPHLILSGGFMLVVFVSSNWELRQTQAGFLLNPWFSFDQRRRCFYLHHSHTPAPIQSFSHTAKHHLSHQLLLCTVQLIILLKWLTFPWYNEPNKRSSISAQPRWSYVSPDSLGHWNAVQPSFSVRIEIVSLLPSSCIHWQMVRQGGAQRACQAVTKPIHNQTFSDITTELICSPKSPNTGRRGRGRCTF